MKKNLFLMMGAIVALSLVGCNKEQGGGNEPEPEKTVAFNIQVTDITATTANVTVEPSDTNAYYYYDVLDAALFDQYTEDSIAAILLSNMADQWEQMGAIYEQYLGIDNMIDAFMSKGNDGYEYSELTPNTDYIAFAFQIDTAALKIKGTMTKKAFKTGEIEMSDNVITVSIDADNNIVVTTTNDDPYNLAIFDNATVLEQGYTDQEIIDYLVEDAATYGTYAGGLQQPTTSVFSAGEEGDYLFAAVGCNGAATTELFKYVLTITSDMVAPAEADDETEPAQIVRKAHIKAVKAPARKIACQILK